MTSFGERARRAMDDRGVSLRTTARAVHYDPGYLSRVLRDIRPASDELARRLDAYFELGGELAALAADRVGYSLANPSRVDAAAVTALADTLASQRRLEDAIGAAAVLPAAMTHLATVAELAKNARGPHRRELLAVVAEWHQFAGWLHASVRQDGPAVELLTAAEELSDEAEDGTVAAVAVSFKGYVARQRGNHRGVVRASHAALYAPGSHPTQRAFDRMQAATGYAALGDRETARRYLDDAATAADAAGDPPPIVYWYTRDFFRMNIGMVALSLGDHADAADHLAAGLAGLPPGQRDAEWTQEYRAALDQARAAA